MHKARKYSKGLTGQNRQYGKRQIPLFYRQGIKAQIIQNYSCFMCLNLTEISVSQTPNCLEHLRCRCWGWPETTPHSAVKVSQTDLTGLWGSLACGAASLSHRNASPQADQTGIPYPCSLMLSQYPFPLALCFSGFGWVFFFQF